MSGTRGDGHLWRSVSVAAGRLARDRSVRLAIGLAFAIAAPLALLAYWQFQSLGDIANTQAMLMKRLSRQANDGITQGIVDSLTAARNAFVLGIPTSDIDPLNHDRLERKLSDILARDTDQLVSRFYVWSMHQGAPEDTTLAFDRDHEHFYVPEESADIFNKIRGEYKQVAGVTFPMTIRGRETHLQTRIRYYDPARTRLQLFTAMAVDMEHLKHSFLPAVAKRLAADWQAPSSLPALVVTVVDESGQVLSPAGGKADGRFEHEAEIPLVFFGEEFLPTQVFGAPYGKLHIRTGYGDRSIPELIADRQRPQRMLILVLALMLVGGVFFVARRTFLEMRLAELRSDFVLSVSHDLKTPLSLIKLFAESLELGRVRNSERRHEYYRVISSETGHLTRLINNIVDFSRSEAGLRSYSLEPGDLAAVTTRVLASFDNQFTQRRVAVSSSLASDLPLTRIDEQAVSQALENLLSNAIKYSPDERQIAVAVDSVDGYVRVVVSDHGIGIPKHLQHKIFRKFYRVNDDARAGVHGCGLGLAIVDHVMRAHGGFVTVESEPGKGSSFTLRFPVYETGEVESEQTYSPYRGRATDVARSA